MGLMDKFKSRIKKEGVELEESKKNLLIDELNKTCIPEQLTLRPRPPIEELKAEPAETIVKPVIEKTVKQELEVINSKIDMIKTQLDSMNHLMMIIKERLK